MPDFWKKSKRGQCLTVISSKRSQASGLLVSAHRGAFVISVPATSPRAFFAPDKSPRPLRPWRPGPGRKQKQSLVGRWSGVDATTEYPCGSDSEDESIWETLPSIEDHDYPYSSGPSAYGTRPSGSVREVVEVPGLKTENQADNAWPPAQSNVPEDVDEEIEIPRQQVSLHQFTNPTDYMICLPMNATKENALLIHCCECLNTLS
jgi:hypothetical protein